MTASEPRWLELLRAEVARKGSIQGAAASVGMSRPAISLALSGRYPSKSTSRLAARVLAALERVECPHLARELQPSQCAAFRARPMPRSIPSDLRHWIACQDCPIGQRLAIAMGKEEKQ
jgi:hypothetical protein